MDRPERERRRRQRLRDELADANVAMRFDGERGRRLIVELDYARFPPRHERSFPTYGALIVDSLDSIPGDALQLTPADDASLAGLRLLADGRQSFVLFEPGRAHLAVFKQAQDRESALVRLQRGSPNHLAIVQRTTHGVVRAFADRRLVVWDGSRWSERPATEAYLADVSRSVPEADPAVLASILDFCIHTLGPAAVGAALVWTLDPNGHHDLGHLRRPAPRLSLPALSILDPLAHGAVRQLLSQVDGATIVDRDGRIIEAAVHLYGSERSGGLVQARAGRGTRHGSARRFSYDEARTVVFVVSEDGPVTVYSDGGIVAGFDERAGRFAEAAPSVEQVCIRCVACEKVFEVARRAERVATANVDCPVCGSPAQSPWPGQATQGWVVKSAREPNEGLDGHPTG